MIVKIFKPVFFDEHNRKQFIGTISNRYAEVTEILLNGMDKYSIKSVHYSKTSKELQLFWSDRGGYIAIKSFDRFIITNN